MVDEFYLKLFGPFQLLRHNQPVALPTRKTEALLAFLALHPGAQRREKLAALLWSEADEQSARRSLRLALTALRKALGEEMIQADRQFVALNTAHLPVDVAEFRRLFADPQATPAELHQAVSLVGGELLETLYEEWVLIEREQLKQQHIQALLRLVRRQRSQSNYSQAIALARCLLEIEPANEEAHQHIMVCLEASGERAAALRQYQACRQQLFDLLGAPPSTETEVIRQRLEKAVHRYAATTALPTNLPTPLSSFIGRAADLENVENLLAPLQRAAPPARLVTLTGPGGSGKTRLAIQAAGELADAYPDGVWWVELAPLTAPEQVVQSLAAALGLQEAPPQPLEQTLLASLKHKHLLLALDNCEHLLEACAALAERILAHTAQVQILSTSREALRLSGEQVYPVPPLPLPPSASESDPTALVSCEAVQLFVERACQADPAFHLTAENGPAVAQICRRLDGLPLALELAATRLRALSAAQIAARLDERFQLLTQGSRAALPRQQTLRALIDWSYDLLTPSEQSLLQRLAVFNGGWTLEAAAAVCAGPGSPNMMAIVDGLASLVEKSLVQADPSRAGGRYSYLETLRAYAAEKLDASPKAPLFRQRHLDFFIQLAEAAEPGLSSQASAAPGLASLRLEDDNLRSALEWSLEHAPGSAVRLAGALWSYWEAEAHYGEGLSWLERSLAAAQAAIPAAHYARALSGRGTLTWRLGNFQGAAQWHESAAAAYRQAGDRRGEAISLHNLAAQCWEMGRIDQAKALELESQAIARQVGDQALVTKTLGTLGLIALWQNDYPVAQTLFSEALRLARQAGQKITEGVALHNLGDLARWQGQLEQALAFYNESLEIAGKFRHQPMTAANHWGLGMTAYAQADYAAARRSLEQGLRLAQEIGSKGTLIDCLEGITLLWGQYGRLRPAARLLGAIQALRQEAGYASGATPDQHNLQELAASLRQGLGQASFQVTWEAGQALDWEAAAALALAGE